jgi:hypothetical protein
MKHLFVSMALVLLFAAPALAQSNSVIGAAQLYVGGTWSARLDLDNSTGSGEYVNIFFLNSFSTANVSVNGSVAGQFFEAYLPPHKITSFTLTRNMPPVPNTWLNVTLRSQGAIFVTGRLTHYDSRRYVCEYPLSALNDHYLINALWTPIEQTAFSIAVPADTGRTLVQIRAIDLDNNEVGRTLLDLVPMFQTALFIGELPNLSLPLGFVGTLEITSIPSNNLVLISTALFRE